MKKLAAVGVIAMLAFTCHPETRRTSDVDEIAWRLKALAQGDGEYDRITALLSLEALARQYRQRAEEAPAKIEKSGYEHPKPDANRCWRMLCVLAEIGDKRSLSLFEEMTASTERFIRFTAVTGYITVAGVMDSLPFIGRLMENPLYTNHERELFYVDLWRRIGASPRPEDEKICDLMLKRSLVEEGGAMTTLDRLLCERLPGYSTSVQRSEFINRAFQSGTEGERNYWNPHKETMDKVPANERKDFRAKGELLDPERQPR